jgi:esterase/lipase/1-acyl-sn-glycerol-3-phosphate acyltransferase
MDRSERLTTFGRDPQPEEPQPGFNSDTMPVTPGAADGEKAETGRIARASRKAAGAALGIIERLINGTIRVEGKHNIGKGPVLFIANHFTRFETFILPWIIHNEHSGRLPHSLAYHELFRGRFGDFLMTMGARPTGNPVVKHTIVENLMTGRNDWLIYPEGSMIKNKKIWANSRFAIDSPDRAGPPHTGAAIMALKAMLYRKLYQRACLLGDRTLMERFESRYHLKGPADIDVPDLQVIPVNITYFPIRPGKNLIYRTARWLFRQLPSVLEEELVIEGSLLLSETDISVYFGKPIDLERYARLIMPTLTASLPFVEQLRAANRTLGVLKNRLTRRMMHEIYTRLTINFDHLFAGGLRALSQVGGGREGIGCEEFHGALYLAARGIQGSGKRRSHPSIGKGLIDLLCGTGFGPLESVQALAKEEGMAMAEGGRYRINLAQLRDQHSFHDIRLKNTLAVIANELEPLRPAIRQLRNAVRLPPTVMRRELSALLLREELADFADERQLLERAGEVTPEDIGRPFVLERANDRVGIVLCHGYLAAPEEVRELAEHLHRLGFAVHCPRLPGHGTAPLALNAVTCADWRRAYGRAVVAMRCRYRHVILAGFSAGALLALDAASRFPGLLGVVAINPSLRLVDKASLLVPSLVTVNHLLDTLHLGHARFDHIANQAENPAINYRQNYFNGVHQLGKLIALTHDRLSAVAAPTLIVQGDHDPVVEPRGAETVRAALGSEEKELAMMAFDRHVIVRGPGSEVVLKRVGDFVLMLKDRLGSLRSEPVEETRPSG